MRKPKTKLGWIRHWLTRKWSQTGTRHETYERVVVILTTPFTQAVKDLS